ncbi:chromosomal replication initiator protein DnaA [Brachyspira hampsonii]|uniref:Chromosomal replication initiator protein DnaA n=1 Tax=Brachyspira hampsonii 30446 TaxID=1289135 RepID=A0A2U4FA19_9SPIR|nr:chromosomal replication initiator protein DnaA [Brachyspira hampsonii]EKV56144.1 chromosomal replication initiation protein [Brachyspira hampsonii 30446]MBW5388921.1 chromosomal replication initiator protein DnaA [Brachyspira hampsonii]MBW5393640.1 chromosomal replication initiator protein DnaA [Brachyspira hampsonii]OEJ18016.1 chromosomal replication initiator protein DnaA [Brachyspira hampsonii]
MEEIKKYWNEFLDIISEDDEFAGVALLKGSIIVSDSENKADIVCSGDFTASHIKKDFLARIKDFFEDRLGHNIDIDVKVDAELVNKYLHIEETEEYSENKENNSNKNILEASKKENSYSKSNLNDYFRFDNFIQGNNNKYVFEAAKYVSSNPGKEYNPLYIYGSVGIGKTHLLQAIGNSYMQNNPNAKVLYIDGSGFRDEYVSGLQNKKPEVFKKRYKSLDMLLLDDLQLLESAQETSKELFEIFQALDNSSKQMVFVSDKPPKELRNIEARLKNRFEKSLILSIEPPQYETRLAIIERKLFDLHTSIDEEVMKYMAENITTDVRKIEGAIRAYLSVRDLMKITPNIEQCDKLEIFKDYFTNKPKLKNATIKEIKKIVADYYGIEISSFESKNRTKFISKARHVAIYLACEYSKKSVTEIGLDFNRDHASVIHARDKVKDELKTGSHLYSEINDIIAGIS